ncbi:MAG: trypsin-like peptidase domain-containing protein [Clostridiales bacterium]|jgi:serine protease Do|nr:trypsin-like peptidase domain-containing protein [Clostridiales bacterium]
MKKVMRNICIFAVFSAIMVSSFVLGMRLGAPGDGFVSQNEMEHIVGTLMAEIDRQNEEAVRAIAASGARYNNAADMFASIDDSVVSINVVQQQMTTGRTRDRHSAGSGVIFHETAERIYIATNYHVIQGADVVTISLDDIRMASASFVGGDQRSDLAVISVLRSSLAEAGIDNYQVATFGDSDAMEIGNFVLAVGNAYGEGKSATLGIVSALDNTITLDVGIVLNVMQTDAAINPGNSGGPLVNTAGEVIGINTARFFSAHSEGMGYAIPSNEAAVILQQILEGGNIVRPVLGVIFETITPQLRDLHNLPTTGVFINQVVRGYAAGNMGLLPGDIITHYDGIRVTDSDHARELIARTAVGGEIVVAVWRDGQEISLRGVMTSYLTSTTKF